MVEKEKTQFEEYKYPVVVIGGAVLITVILAFVVGKPLFNSMQKTSNELKEKEVVLKLLEEKLVNLRNLESREEELKTENQKVLAALPEEKDVSRLFVQFEKIAAETGVNIATVAEAQSDTTSESSPESQGAISSVTYTVNGNASDYIALKNALARFEDALRLLSISKFDATSSSDGLSINFTINTYIRS